MISTIDIAWAAGFLEGEGTFWTSPNRKTSISVRASQVQREPLERLLRMFGGRIALYANGKPSPNAQPIHLWYVSGRRAASVAMTIIGLLSPRRFTQAIAMLNKWKSQSRPQYGTGVHCSLGHERKLRTRGSGKMSWYCPTCQASKANKKARAT